MICLWAFLAALQSSTEPKTPARTSLPSLHRLWVAVRPYALKGGSLKRYLRFSPDGRFVATDVDPKTGRRRRTEGTYRFEGDASALQTGEPSIGLYEDFASARRDETRKNWIAAAQKAGLPGVPIVPRLLYFEKIPALTDLVVGFAPVDDVPHVRRLLDRR